MTARPVRAGSRSTSSGRGRLSATHPSPVRSSRQDPLAEIRPCRRRPNNAARPDTAASQSTRTGRPKARVRCSISATRPARAAGNPSGGRTGARSGQPVSAIRPERARALTASTGPALTGSTGPGRHGRTSWRAPVESKPAWLSCPRWATISTTITRRPPRISTGSRRPPIGAGCGPPWCSSWPSWSPRWWWRWRPTRWRCWPTPATCSSTRAPSASPSGPCIWRPDRPGIPGRSGSSGPRSSRPPATASPCWSSPPLLTFVSVRRLVHPQSVHGLAVLDHRRRGRGHQPGGRLGAVAGQSLEPQRRGGVPAHPLGSLRVPGHRPGRRHHRHHRVRPGRPHRLAGRRGADAAGVMGLAQGVHAGAAGGGPRSGRPGGHPRPPAGAAPRPGRPRPPCVDRHLRSARPSRPTW